MNNTLIAEHLVESLYLFNALYTKTSCGICTFVQLTNYYDTSNSRCVEVTDY